MGTQLGSSPLARGLQRDSLRVVARARIIPARAEFTATGGGQALCLPDHPRSRGVYNLRSAKTAGSRGSSPLARGLPKAAAARYRRRGIIPARAGFTAGFFTTSRMLPDHPRSRGVYGSGKSSLAATADHPRSRGVYQPPSVEIMPGMGSSPLARGLRVPPPRHSHHVRIIPARAGFTGTSTPSQSPRQDHPRSRGVYPRSRLWCTNISGSSPLARGLLLHSVAMGRRYGIIPARAGFTLPAIGPPKITTDHPRSRGVYSALFRAFRHNGGSSPLARGLLVAMVV